MREYKPRYVMAGIALVMAIVVASALTDPTGKTGITIALVLVPIGFAALLVYQWKTVGTYREPPPATPVPAGGDAGEITDAAEMMALLAERPIGPKERRAAGVETASMARASIGLGAIIGFLGITFTILLETRIIDPNSVSWIGELAPFAPIVLLPLAMLWVRWMMGRSQRVANLSMEPLDLELTDMPDIRVGPRGFGDGKQGRAVGPTVMQGKRHGLPVRVELDSGEQVTKVGKSAPAFELSEAKGRLHAGSNAPAPVRTLVEKLKPSQQWRGIDKVEAGERGIVVNRSGSTPNGWMWDLWLAERLVEALDA
jgi:hypothetical protein